MMVQDANVCWARFRSATTSFRLGETFHWHSHPIKKLSKYQVVVQDVNVVWTRIRSAHYVVEAGRDGSNVEQEENTASLQKTFNATDGCTIFLFSRGR